MAQQTRKPTNDMKKVIKLSDLVLDAGTQVRAEMDQETIEEYAKAYKAKAHFPAIHVFVDGNKYLVADGFHRAMAAEKAGLKTIEAELYSGSRSDCLKFALSCNASHGLRRTNADKHKAVEIALVEFPELTNAKISIICAVGDDLVSEIRKAMEGEAKIPKIAVRTASDGRVFAMPTKPRGPKMPVKEPPLHDATGHPVPPKLVKLWHEAEGVQPLLTSLSGIRSTLRNAQENKVIIYARLNFSSIQSHLDMAYAELKDVKPHAVCTACQGLNPGNCRLCKGLGFFGEFVWKTAVPREDKEIRMKARAA